MMPVTNTTTSTSSLKLPQETWQMIQQFADETKQLLQDEMMAEYLFGSYATNTQTAVSDIDILIIVKHFRPELQRQVSGLASDYSLEYDTYISPIIQGQEAWEKNKRYHTLLYQDVTKYGIPL